MTIVEYVRQTDSPEHTFLEWAAFQHIRSEFKISSGLRNNARNTITFVNVIMKQKALIPICITKIYKRKLIIIGN